MNYAQIVEMCCRDLRQYLQDALASARGGVVSVKVGRVLAVRRIYDLKRHYAYCLLQLLRPYRFNRGLYVLTRQQAEELLRNLDVLCAEIAPKDKTLKQPAPKDKTHKQERPASIDGEKMVLISFHLPHALLCALDEYVRQRGVARSDVVRMAIKQMLDNMRAAKELAEKEELRYVVAV